MSPPQQREPFDELRLDDDAARTFLCQDAVAQRREGRAPPLERILPACGAIKQHRRETKHQGKLKFRPFHQKNRPSQEDTLSMGGFPVS